MKFLKSFGLPFKITLVFVLATYLPLLIAGFFSFEFAKKTEKKFGLKMYNKMAEMEVENLMAQLDRLKSEILILSRNGAIQKLLKIHEENPTLGSQKLMKLQNYQNLVSEIEERLRLILPSNPSLNGIGFFIGDENVLAIDEDKISHVINLKKNVPIPFGLLDKYHAISFPDQGGIWHSNKSYLFPFNKINAKDLDSIMGFQGFSDSSKKTSYIITFFNNPFVNIKKFGLKEITIPDHSFSLVLKENKEGIIEYFNTDADNAQLVKNFYEKLPQSFLKQNNSEYIDNNGNIYTIRKIQMGLINLDKLVLVTLYPSKIIRGPFEETRYLTIKILGLCSFFIIPFLFFTLNAIISGLRGVTGDLERTSNTLKKSTKEIQETSSIIKKSNNENKNRVNDITSAMDQMVFTNQSFQAEVNEMSSLSKKTSNSALEGRNDVNDLAISMDQIIESSRNIFKIINIIENISLQTNILSMNASVEAARAGEHGKGFAVVAEAIRNLAQKSSNSAAEIGKLVQDAINISEKGSHKAAENRAKFKEILENIEKLNEFVDKTSSNLVGRMEKFTILGLELKKINLAVADGSVQTEKHSEIAIKLSNEADSLKESINKILIMVEGKKNNGDGAS